MGSHLALDAFAAGVADTLPLVLRRRFALCR